MEKLYKYATDNSELEITQLQSQLVKLDVSGKFTSDNIDELFLATDKIFEKFDQAYLIVNVKNFSSFPWNKRKFVYDTIDSWYKNKNVSHILIVSANSFIKMLGFLAGSFYKEIAHSFYHKESDALNAYKNLNFKSNGDINPSTIHEALESKKSSSYVEIEFYDKWEHSKSLIEVYFLKPDILYMRQVGKLSSDSVGILQNYIEKRSESCSGVRLVLDMSQCTGISRDARKRFSEHSIRINNLLRFKFFKFPAFVSSLYKIYTFINPSYDETTQMISDPEGVLYQLLTDQNPASNAISIPSEVIEFDRDSFEDFPKEELIDYLEEFYNENKELRQSTNKNIDLIFEVISKITWNEDTDFKNLEVPKENDPFHNLFQAVNILQNDIGEIIQHLKDSNIDLKSTVHQKESNLRSLIENYDSPICLLDRDFRLMESNNVFHNLMQLGYNSQVKKGHIFLKSFDDKIMERWKKRFTSCLNGKYSNFREEFEFENEYYYFDIRIFPIEFENQIIGIGIVGNNITDLQRSKKKLEDQNISLSKLNNELDSFIYRSSHDLRAPVSSLLGLINIAKIEKDLKEKDRCLDLMEVSVNKMEAFIREIIDHTKNIKFDLEPTEVHLHKIIDELVKELKHLDHTRRIKFEINADMRAFVTDKFRIQTVLSNILSNSIKYHDPDKEPIIYIDVKHNLETVNIQVKDNGQGIRKEHMPKLYDMFYRANESSNGTGLGLYIVKDVLEKLNGTISIDSHFGEGSTVSIDIPSLQIPVDD